MGYRQAAVLASVSFFLGVLFLCFSVDYKILFAPLTEDIINDGLAFYTTFYHSPAAIKALMHAVMGVGIFGIIGKLHKWDETAMFFDGSSLAAYVFAIAVYLSVAVPASRTVAVPLAEESRGDQVAALRVLSAGNTIVIVLLGAVLTLQAGEEYARRLDTTAAAAAKHAQPRAQDAGEERDRESRKNK